MIPDEVVERVREAADIVALIGEHVELKRTGSDYRGPCPFHGGTHRNFSVVPKKQMYHCFVCHEAGDVFTFWMKRFGLDYPSAVREIADKVGVTVPQRTEAGPGPHEALYSAIGVAADWFARRLAEGEDAGAARAYLDEREIPIEVRQRHQLGYAPRRGEEILTAFGALGLEERVAEDAGLAARREDGRLAARFRGRLVFPIADARGRWVGFGGRVLGRGEPKYLNSPETPIFHKGALLFGLHLAKGAIRTQEVAVVVEGYFDVLRLHAAGIEPAVAPLGTALTALQAGLLRRYTKQVVLVYDADTPGLRSSFRGADELLRRGLSVRVATLPPGEDPDSLVRREGAGGLRRLLDQAVDVFERKIQLLERKGYFGTLEGRRRALDRLLPTILAAAEPITRDLYLARAAEKAGVARGVLENELARGGAGVPGDRDGSGPSGFRRSPSEAGAAGSAAPRSADSASSSTRHASLPRPDIPNERTLIHLMAADPSWLARARESVKPEEFRHPDYREIAGALFAGEVGGLSPSAHEIWLRLRAIPFGDRDAEAEFQGAIGWMAWRRLRERLEEIDRLIDLADPDVKLSLAEEKRALESESRRFGRYRSKALRTEREPKD